MTDDTAKRPDIQERYESAANTVTLKMVMREEAPIGAADILAAAGMMHVKHDDDKRPPIVWSATRAGMALLRLHSEWDAAAKPRKPSPDLIEALCVTIRTEDAQAKAHRGSVAVRAHARAQAWYVSELRLLAVSLKSRAAVWEQLEHWRALRGIDPETVAAALLHWLDPKCPHCEGHGLRKVEGAPAHSARPCRDCNGGERYRPAGSAIVLNFLDDAVSKARSSLSSRLRDRR